MTNKCKLNIQQKLLLKVTNCLYKQYIFGNLYNTKYFLANPNLTNYELARNELDLIQKTINSILPVSLNIVNFCTENNNFLTPLIRIVVFTDDGKPIYDSKYNCDAVKNYNKITITQFKNGIVNELTNPKYLGYNWPGSFIQNLSNVITDFYASNLNTLNFTKKTSDLLDEQVPWIAYEDKQSILVEALRLRTLFKICQPNNYENFCKLKISNNTDNLDNLDNNLDNNLIRSTQVLNVRKEQIYVNQIIPIVNNLIKGVLYLDLTETFIYVYQLNTSPILSELIPTRLVVTEASITQRTGCAGIANTGFIRFSIETDIDCFSFN